MSVEYELEVFQNGEWCASTIGQDWERVYADAMHYAMIYGQDGPTEIRGIPAEKMDWLKSRLAAAGQRILPPHHRNPYHTRRCDRNSSSRAPYSCCPSQPMSGW